MNPLDCILSATGDSLIKHGLSAYRKVVSNVCINQVFCCRWTGHALVTSGKTSSVNKDYDRCVLGDLLWTVEVELLTSIGTVCELFAGCRLDVASALLVQGVVCLHRRHQGREDRASELR